jgi:hypothetical protein
LKSGATWTYSLHTKSNTAEGIKLFSLEEKLMTKYALMLAAAGLLVATPAVVKAEEAAAPAPAAEAPAAVEAELADGTKVMIEGDMVSVVAADGAKTPAPDGEHTLKDGSKVVTKDGKIVK